jgi:hypothetical protein
MWQTDLARTFLDAWINVGRAPWGDVGRQKPFPRGNEGPRRSDAGRETDNVYAQRFLTMMQRLNTVTEASAKINHAWVSLALSRFAEMWGGADVREADHESRKHAIEQLVNTYPYLLREYARGWSDVLALLLPPEARR